MAYFTPEELSAFRNAMRTAKSPAPQASRQGGRGGFLTSLISEGGAVGGAALGTALLPGIGTLLGAGLGAFGGRLAENQVRDDRWGVGDATKEGALSGIFAGVGPAFKAVKGAGAVARAGGGLEDALMAAKSGFSSKPGAAGASRLANASQSLKSGVINPKTKAGVFGAGEDADIVRVVDKYVKGTNATQKYGNLESAFTGLSDDIQKTLRPIKKSTSSVDFTKRITQSLADDINYIPGDAAYERELGRVLNKVASFGKDGKLSPTSLFEAKQYLGSQLKGAFGKNGADLSVPQQVRMAVWERLDDTITDLAPKVKELTTAQSTLIKSAPGLQKNASKAFGAPILGIKSKTLERGLQRGQYTAAKGLDALSGAGSATAPLRRAATPQLLGRGLTGGQELNNPMTQNMTDPMMATTNMPANTSTMMGQSYNDMPTESNPSPFAPESIEGNVQKIIQGGGSLSDVMEYIKVAEAINKLTGSSGGARKLSGAQQKEANTALSALSDLQLMSGEIGRDGSVAAKAALPFDSLTNRVTGAGQFEAARRNIVDALARLRSGAALTKDEMENFGQLTPTSFDSPADVQAKLQRLQEIFERTAYGQTGGETSLEDAILQYSQ